MKVETLKIWSCQIKTAEFPMLQPNSLSAEQSLESFLQKSQARTNACLQNLLQHSTPNAKLNEALNYACLNGGKRIRPVLVYATTLAVDGNLDSADAPACAVELIHSYSLVHDDLPAMDDDDLRRGKPSLHKAYDEATAILVGDALQSLAFQVLSSQENTLPDSTRLRMLDTLAKAIGSNGMVGGQFADFSLVGKETNIDELESMHRMKTGALIRASVTLGALTQTTVNSGSLQALQSYAESIGLAFQVQDDVLDEVGDTKTLGKPQGSDRLNNKPTYVALLGLEQAQAKALELADRARDSLSEFGPAADQLRNLASFIVSRTH